MSDDAEPIRTGRFLVGQVYVGGFRSGETVSTGFVAGQIAPPQQDHAETATGGEHVDDADAE